MPLTIESQEVQRPAVAKALGVCWSSGSQMWTMEPSPGRNQWLTRWWFQVSNNYCLFSPLPGEMIQFDEYFFQMVWNHQLANFVPFLVLSRPQDSRGPTLQTIKTKSRFSKPCMDRNMGTFFLYLSPVPCYRGFGPAVSNWPMFSFEA